MTLATVPLAKLPFVSVDLETTGLSPKTDRIVQIGMIDPWKESEQIDLLVNPTIPIPEKSTAIHGINDKMVAKAETITRALPKIRDRINGRVILGYNIGFDLAVLAAEAERHGLEWEWNAAICVRQLAVITLGRQAAMMIDLNGLADYYGVTTKARHTALGDAKMTGRIFKAMLPDLKEKSIITLADALRASANLDDMRLATTRAGWVDIATHQHKPTKSAERIDPYPYQHRISEMMLKNPIIMPKDTLARDAAIMMQKKKTDCIFIGSAAGEIEGVVTERDLIDILTLPIEKGDHARKIPVNKLMSTPVITVNEDDFMYIALGRISRFDIRNLGVINHAGKLVGWISTRELIRQRVTGAMVIGDQISTAEGASDIATALNALPMLSRSLLDDGVAAHLIAAIISSAYRAALERAAVLGAAMMKPSPPCPYAVLMLGSAGRGESLLAADQDHAIVYDDADIKDKAGAAIWFQTLGGHIADILDQAGIPYCQGKVMSNNPKWCRSLSGWRKAVDGWVTHTTPEDMLSVDIFFDFQPVHGDMHLAAKLQKAILVAQTRQVAFLKSLAGNVNGGSAGVSVFGKFKTESGRFNVKRHLLLSLIETLRVLSVSRGIDKKSSAARAEALHHSGTVPPEVPLLAEDIHFAIKLVLRQQIEDISVGLSPGTGIKVSNLSANEQRLLKSVCGRVGRLDTVLQDCLFGS